MVKIYNTKKTVWLVCPRAAERTNHPSQGRREMITLVVCVFKTVNLGGGGGGGSMHRH